MNIEIKFEHDIRRINSTVPGAIIAQDIIEACGDLSNETTVGLMFENHVVNVAPAFVTAFMETFETAYPGISNILLIEGSPNVEQRFALEINYYKKLHEAKK